jgi:hypothetical protein
MTLTTIEGARTAPDAPAAVRCPKPGCGRTFSCDGCLHAHLVRRYQVRYADAFGPVHDAWVEFCDEHRGMSPSALGV